jgi:hypothetical protein
MQKLKETILYRTLKQPASFLSNNVAQKVTYSFVLGELGAVRDSVKLYLHWWRRYCIELR